MTITSPRPTCQDVSATAFSKWAVKDCACRGKSHGTIPCDSSWVSPQRSPRAPLPFPHRIRSQRKESRVTPTIAAASQYPRLISPPASPALLARNGGCRLRLSRLEITATGQNSTASHNYGLITLGDGENTLEAQPSEITLDRVWISRHVDNEHEEHRGATTAARGRRCGPVTIHLETLARSALPVPAHRAARR